MTLRHASSSIAHVHIKPRMVCGFYVYILHAESAACGAIEYHGMGGKLAEQSVGEGAFLRKQWHFEKQ